jgi:hypothetical protein
MFIARFPTSSYHLTREAALPETDALLQLGYNVVGLEASTDWL